MKKYNTIVPPAKFQSEPIAFIQKDHLIFAVIIGCLVIYVVIESLRRQRHVTRMLEKLFFQFQEREDSLWSHFICVARDQALEDVGKVIEKACIAAEEAKAVRQEIGLLQQEILSATKEIVPLLQDWKSKRGDEEPVISATDVPDIARTKEQ